jgi:hypothetical protein
MNWVNSDDVPGSPGKNYASGYIAIRPPSNRLLEKETAVQHELVYGGMRGHGLHAAACAIKMGIY